MLAYCKNNNVKILFLKYQFQITILNTHFWYAPFKTDSQRTNLRWVNNFNYTYCNNIVY